MTAGSAVFTDANILVYFAFPDLTWHAAEDNADVTALLLDLLENPGAQGKQVHDANIAATMRHYGIPYLLTPWLP